MPLERGSLEPLLKDEVEFRPWQIDGIRYLAHKPSFLLSDEMGLGKSLEALTIFAIDAYMKLCESGLIVCPPTLIENWCNEIEKFTRIPYVVLSGAPHKRNNTLIEFSGIKGPKLLITNYEKIRLHLKVLNALRFGAGIFDEAHLIKGAETKRTTSVHDLHNGRSMLLTGTPMLGHVNDLWGLLYKIDPMLVPNYYSFVNEFAVFGGYKGKSIIGTKNERKLRAIMDKVQLRRLAKDHLGLEEPFVVERWVGLTDEQRKVYDRIKQDMKTPQADGSEDDIKFDIVVNTRLRQVCTNLLAFTGEDISPKLDLCMEDDQEIFENGEKVVVFTQFLEMQEVYLKRHVAKYGNSIPAFEINGSVKDIKRVGVVNQWEAIKGPAVLVCMYQVSGVGLNMTASHNVAMLDKLYVPGLNQQAIGRVLRLGQKYPVTVREYKTRGTVETRVETINKNKIKNAAKIVEARPWRDALKDKLIAEGKVSELWVP